MDEIPVPPVPEMLEAKPAAGSGVPVCPVCGMTADPKSAKAVGRVTAYLGKDYYFCRDICKERFDKALGVFLEKRGNPASSAPR